MLAPKDERFDNILDKRDSQPHQATRGLRRPSQQLPTPQRHLYTDEHPEIPKVRRALLYLDPSLTTNHHPTTQAKNVRNLYTRRTKPTKGSRSLHTYEPQVHHRQRKKQVFSPLYFFPQLAKHQHTLIIAGIALAMIFILINNLVQSLFPSLPIYTIIRTSNTTEKVNASPNATTSADQHSLVITPTNSDHPSPPVYAKGAYLLDADTGATLYAHNPFLHLPVMSTTKLMTALLAVEHGQLDRTITINNQIANDIKRLSPDSSVIRIKKGESYTLKEMLYGLLLASGNDAAIAIGNTIGGTYAHFVEMMNQKAAALGMRNTHFANPHGLQEQNHYSCARDLAILGQYSLSIPLIHQISSTLNYHIDQTAHHPAHDFFNGNQFIWWYPGADAGKPGYDAATNFVQVVSCVRNNRHLIGVTIHTIDWWTDMRNLMNWGFNTFTWISPRNLNTPTHPIPYADLWHNFERDKKDNTIPLPNHGRYYIYTGYSITGDIQRYFDNNGGLKSFGFPTSQPSPAGTTALNQRFEHATIQCALENHQCRRVSERV
jgi:D-alanyl-D-alanine carboxypeptidase